MTCDPRWHINNIYYNDILHGFNACEVKYEYKFSQTLMVFNVLVRVP